MRKENSDHTLQTTALVNEAYIRLVDQNKTHWQNRAHFFGIAAQIMRRILLNYARDSKRQKRFPGSIQVSLSDVVVVSDQQSSDLIILNEALERLSVLDQRKGRGVELRFFGGLDINEIAEVLQVSPITVMRDWKFAKAWLSREMGSAQ